MKCLYNQKEKINHSLIFSVLYHYIWTPVLSNGEGYGLSAPHRGVWSAHSPREGGMGAECLHRGMGTRASPLNANTHPSLVVFYLQNRLWPLLK